MVPSNCLTCRAIISIIIINIKYKTITLPTELFAFLLPSIYLLHASVCIISSFLCHDKKQAISWNFMQNYVVCHNYHSTHSGAHTLSHTYISSNPYLICVIVTVSPHMVWYHKVYVATWKQPIICLWLSQTLKWLTKKMINRISDHQHYDQQWLLFGYIP